MQTRHLTRNTSKPYRPSLVNQIVNETDFQIPKAEEKPLVFLTVCVTGAGAGVDSVWEQEKLEARKMLVNRAESPASSARFVRRCLITG